MVKIPEETKEEVQPDRSFSRRGASRTSNHSRRSEEGVEQEYDIEEGRPMNSDSGRGSSGRGSSRRGRSTQSRDSKQGSGKQNDESEGGGGSGSLRRRGRSGKARKRGSSRIRTFLTRMGESFRRSQGNRGASVEILRGSRGAEFEGQARVVRGEVWGNCGGCMQEDEDELAEKHLLIKGPFCFVFYEDDDLAPRYAIPLEKMKGIVRDTYKGNTVVTLERKGEVEYEISFDNVNVAKDFRDAVAKQAASVRAESIAKKRGANGPLKHTSVRYAEAVARLKIELQPEKETALTSEDVLDANF